MTTSRDVEEALKLQYQLRMEEPLIKKRYNEPLKDFLAAKNSEFYSEIITICGNRVVRLTSKTNQPLGSGILFRMGNKTFIQTCEHVVEDKPTEGIRDPVEAVKAIAGIGVDVEDNRTQTVNVIDHYWGGCKKQDRAILRMRGKLPADLRKNNVIPDITPFVVDIRVGKFKPHQPFKGLIEYHSSEKGFIVHAMVLDTPPELDADTEVTCTFLIDNSSTVCSIRDVCYCSETGCALIFVGNDAIPTEARELFKGTSYLEDIQNTHVYVISYPNPDSRLKYISTGDLYEGVREENGDLKYKKRRDDKVCFEIEHSGRRGPPNISGIYYTDDNGDIHPYTGDERGCVDREGGRSTNRVKNVFRRDSEGNMFYLQLDYRTQRLYNNEMPKQNIVFTHNDAVTTNGSSGGCVLIVGTDKRESSKYRYIINMHYGKSIQPPVNKSIMYDYCGK